MPANAVEVTRLVYSGLEKEGYRGRIISLRHIADVRAEIESRYGVLDDVFYRERLTHFRYYTADVSGANSIIITSAPQPRQRVTFNYRGETYHFTVPPTYSGRTDETIENILSNILRPGGFSLHPAVLPEKTLAVHSGLAEYGRNNIAYIKGMGSFHRLKVFLSDIPAVKDTWLKLKSMQRCDRCLACVNKCPTKAIAPDRFLIQAERCLTFHNERPGEFPDWVNPSWHNCLIGCMECQLACPVNKKFNNWFEETESFTEQETEAILKGVSRHQLPETAAGKLERLYLLDDLSLMPRNLGVLIKKYQEVAG